MRKEKKKEETERERMERLNREYNDIDWVGPYNSDKLSSLRVDELSLYFSHQKITFKGKKAEATWINFFLAKKNCDPPPVANKTGLSLPNL